MTKYQDNVRAAAAALARGDDANWELARLTFESTRSRGETDKPTMEQWTDDVRQASGRRFGVSTGEKYKILWRRYSNPELREGLSWNEAYEEAFGGGRSLNERMIEPNFNNLMIHATPEFKREAFAALAREPEVIADLPTSTEVFNQIVRDNPAAVQEAWKDTQTNVALSTARWEARDELHEPLHEAVRDTREIFEPKDATLDRRIFLADVATKVEQWTRELNGIREFLEFSDDVDRIRRWSTRQALDRLVEAATACRDALPASYAEEQSGEVVSPTKRRKLTAS